MIRSSLRPVLLGSCAAAGVTLATGLGAAALLRRDKPLHAAGSCWRGVWTPSGPGAGPTAPMAGEFPALVRVSQAMSVGLPVDVGGVAVRLTGAGAGGSDADLLFATTGEGRTGRWLLRLVSVRRPGVLTTLLPYDRGGRPFWFRLSPDGAQRWRVSTSDGGPWTEVAVLSAAEQVPDEGVRFDPIGRVPAGLRWPAWVVALRSPAYAAARRLAPSGRARRRH